MTDQELRALVRDAVQRHLGSTAVAPASPVAPVRAIRSALEPRHPSHGVYLLVNVGEACQIEPAVTCNHCEYCKSHGY